MEEYRKVSAEQRAMLDTPLPADAVKPHPTKTYLSSIKSIYVTERLNSVFGVGAWQIASDVVDKGEKGMIVVKTTFSVPEYNIRYECYGGNDNGGEGGKQFDLGDAYKGAVTDSITKIGSWLGIGADVFKGIKSAPAKPTADPIATTTPAKPAERKPLLLVHLEDDTKRAQVMQWVYNAHSLAKDPIKFNPCEWLKERRIVGSDAMAKFKELYTTYYAEKQKSK